MIKSIFRIILLLLLTIGIGIGSFTYGINQGYKLGVYDSNTYLLQESINRDIDNLISNMIFSKHYNSQQIEKENKKTLESLLELHFIHKDAETRTDSIYLDYSIIQESSKNIKNVFSRDFYIDKTKSYIEKYYSKEEIEKSDVIKRFLQENSK